MSVQTPTLADFLLARIAEDEAQFDLPDYDVVLNSHGEVSARGEGWVTRGDCRICGAYMFDGTEVVTEEAWWDHAEKAHQRTRVLAECDAKRRIVEAASLTIDRYGSGTVLDLAWETLRLLALPYTDHPDFRDEWRP